MMCKINSDFCLLLAWQSERERKSGRALTHLNVLHWFFVDRFVLFVFIALVEVLGVWWREYSDTVCFWLCLILDLHIGYCCWSNFFSLSFTHSRCCLYGLTVELCKYVSHKHLLPDHPDGQSRMCTGVYELGGERTRLRLPLHLHLEMEILCAVVLMFFFSIFLLLLLLIPKIFVARNLVCRWLLYKLIHDIIKLKINI